MNYSILKKITALAGAFALLTQGAVFAAPIASLPWSNNFDSIGEVKYTSSSDPTQNEIGAQLYFDKGEVSVIEDTDPAHGKVLKFQKGEGSNVECFMGFSIPGVESGKYFVKFDAKSMGGSSTLAGQYNGPNGWNSLVGISGEEWKSYKLLIDNDKESTTIYNGDEVTTKKNTDTSLGKDIKVNYLKFIVWSKSVAFDNFEVFKLDGNTDVKLMSGTDEISYYAPCTDTLELSPENWGFGALKGEVTLTDCGANPFYKENINVPVTASLENGKIVVKLSKALSDGHRYTLTLPEKQVDEFEETLSQYSFDFKAAASGGMSENLHQINFSGMTNDDLNTPAKNAYVAGGSGLRYLNLSSKTEAVIASESSCTGGSALNIKNNKGTIYNEFSAGTNYKNGVIKVDARIKVAAGNVDVGIGNSSAYAHIISASNNSAVIYSQEKIGASAEEKETVETNDGWVTMSYSFDLSKKTASYTVNGQSGKLAEGKLPIYDGSKNIMDTGVNFLSFKSTQSGGEYLIDYVNYTLYSLAPDVKTVNFTDVNGKTINYEKGASLNPGIDTVNIVFTSDMDVSSLSGIKMLDKDGNPVDFDGAYLKDKMTYKITLLDCLEQNSEYSIEIPKSAKSLDGSMMTSDVKGSFSTGEGSCEIVSFEILNGSGNAAVGISDLSGKAKIVADVVNTKREAEDLSIVYNENKDKLMKRMLYKDFKVLPEQRRTKLTFEVSVGSDIDEIRALLWNNVEEHIPQADPVKLK